MASIKKDPNGYTPANGLDLGLIAPNCGFKYSPNLHRFLKKHASLARMARLFIDSTGVRYLGFIDDTDSLIGARLNQVLSMGTKTPVFCYSTLGVLTEHESFWAEYVADGRCALDREHTTPFVGDQTRWRTAGEHRSCLWCGKMTQTLRRWTETKVVERESWEPQGAGAQLQAL
jgi:hypothetical protein